MIRTGSSANHHRPNKQQSHVNSYMPAPGLTCRSGYNRLHNPHVSIQIRDGHADADIRINFRIIRQYRAISDMRIAKNICMAIPNPNIHTIGHMTWENPKWTTYPHEAVAKLSDIHGGYYCAGDFAGSLSIRGLTRALCREALSGAGRWKADLGKGLSSRILFWNQVRLVQKNFLWL